MTMLPGSCKQALSDHLRKVRQLHLEDLRKGLDRALPDALALKYPGADGEWAWQYVFPASSCYTDARSGIRHRPHLHETVVQKVMAEAVRHTGIAKLATPHSLRHCAGSRIMPGCFACLGASLPKRPDLWLDYPA
jgi:integrase